MSVASGEGGKAGESLVNFIVLSSDTELKKYYAFSNLQHLHDFREKISREIAQ